MGKLQKKLISFLAAMAVVIGTVMAPASTMDVAAAPAVEENLSGQIIILHTNDVHGAVDGYAKAAALKQDYEKKGAFVLLVDAGDYIQGDPSVSVFQGDDAIKFMNIAGYDLATLGNHEFDYGVQNLEAIMSQANFPVLAANVKKDGKLLFGDQKMVTAPNGVKIGFFGLLTPETATKSHPAKRQGVTFEAGGNLYQLAQKQVDSLKAAGADYVVCLAHLGVDYESERNRSTDVIAHVDGIDVFIDGHSHTTMDEENMVLQLQQIQTNTVLTSTGTKFENIGKVTLADGKVKAELLDTADMPADNLVQAYVNMFTTAVDANYGETFAQTEVDLDGVRSHVRTQETNLGNLICDAMVWCAQKNGEKVDGAINNGGGIRASIDTGAITRKAINAVLPFGNSVSIVKVTGAQLLEALEASTFSTPEELGGFPQVAGIEYTVNTAAPFVSSANYKDSTYQKPDSINRVTIQSIGGQPFNKDAVYTIATNDFLAAGGDACHAFVDASVNYDLGKTLDEIVVSFIKDELGGVVTAEKYGKARGLVVIK